MSSCVSVNSGLLVAIRLVLRARYLVIFCCALLLLVGSGLLAAQFSGRQPAAVALDVGFSIMRLVLPLVAVFIVQELISQEFVRRHFLTSFTYPVSRVEVLLGRFLALVILVFFLLIVMGVLLSFLVSFVSSGYAQSTPVKLGFHFWIAISFLALDLFVLMSVACFLAVVASTQSFVLIGVFGFMLIARSYGAIVELLGREAGLVSSTENYRAGLGVLGYLLPDLGALDVRMIAVYGRMDFLPADWLWLLLSSLTYACALLALAVWAQQRKRFA